jgi:hypothetical protein
MKRALSAFAAALALAGCGGGAAQTTTRPVLPHDLGAQLAAQTDRVQQELAAGQVAKARRDATDVQRAVLAAVDAGTVPRALREPLVAGVDRLVALIPKPEQTKPGKGHGKHKGKKKHGEGND